MGTDSLLGPGESSGQSLWFPWALAQLWGMRFISLNVDVCLWAIVYLSFIVAGGKQLVFYGVGEAACFRMQLSHPNVDVWKRFSESCPKTTYLSPLSINGARVTSWGGDESFSHWVKESASAALCLSYGITQPAWDSSPLSACTKCFLVPAVCLRQANSNGQFSSVQIVPFYGKWSLEHRSICKLKN